MSIIYQKFCVPRNSYNWIIALVCQANHNKTPARPTLKVFEDKVLHLHCNVICKRLACLFFSDKDESRVGPVLQSPFLWNSVRRTLKDPRTARIRSRDIVPCVVVYLKFAFTSRRIYTTITKLIVNCALISLAQVPHPVLLLITIY